MSEMERAWHAHEPESMADALTNIHWAASEMLKALDEGHYRFEEVHVRADLSYLLAEARRARRQRLRDAAALAARAERAEAKVARCEALMSEHLTHDALRAALSAPQPADAPGGHGDADEAGGGL